jgi:hypothetical protein
MKVKGDVVSELTYDFGDIIDPGYMQSMAMELGPDSGILQRQVNQPEAGKSPFGFDRLY